MKRLIFTITILSVFLCSYGNEDNKDNYQIPSDKLSLMSTSEVLDLCLDYPYIIDVIAYHDINKGFNKVSSRFNGFSELYTRKDLLNTILDKLNELPSKTKVIEELTIIEKGKLSTSYMVLELIASQDKFFDSLDRKSQNQLISSFESSLSIMKDYPKVFGGMHNKIISSLIGKLVPAKAINYAVDTVHTPNQTPVTVYTFNAEHSEYEIIYWDNYYHNEYGVDIICSSTMKYNCHSYAWYMRGDTTKTRYWMDNPFNYISDWSYEETDSTQAEIVCYETATGFIQHSARRIGTGIYESKWGDGPLVTHTLMGTPYTYEDYGVTQYIYYKRTEPYISGPVIPCGESAYSLMKIPSSFTINWSFSGTIPSGTMTANSPSNTQCTRNNNNSSYIKGNLTANIYNSGFHVATLNKEVNTGSGFSASYTGIPYPLLLPSGTTISGTIQSGDVINVFNNYSFVFTSNAFASYNVSYTGNAVQNWVNSGNGSISFKAVNTNPGTTSVIVIDGISGCNHFRFRINVNHLPTYNLTESSLEVTQTGNICNITLMPEYGQDEAYEQSSTLSTEKGLDMEWDLKVVNSLTGEVVYEGHIVGESIAIDTSRWPAGVYVFTVQMGDQTVSKKIVVK